METKNEFWVLKEGIYLKNMHTREWCGHFKHYFRKVKKLVCRAGAVLYPS